MKNQKKISFPSNLHGHTTYCDGKNRAEEYILAAIEKNFVSVGLSGHSYVYFDKEPNMSLEGTLKYIEELKILKEKYKDKIQVYIGIEADFYSGFNPKLDKNLGLDYRIGSVHYVKDKVKDKYYCVDNTPEILAYAIENYDNGDERFHPENIIFDSREANFIAIISKKTGKIVWKIGPNWNDDDIKHIDFIIGPHHAHLIPQGLPGAGNILVFDNGGWGGYGLPNPSSKNGLKNALRDYSRVLEIDPITLEIVWEFTPESIKAAIPTDAAKFYSPYVSSAQRLPNGNTLIDEGSDGRVFEVTAEKEVVWEWISPYFTDAGKITNNMIYRAYRYPYEWVPQEEKPIEKEIKPLDIKTYRLENAGKFGAKTVVKVEGTIPYSVSDALCVAKIDESKKLNTEKLFTVNRNLFEEIVEDNKKVEKLELILFGAERCRHCKALHPVIEKVLESDLAKSIKAKYVDVDKNPEITEKYKVQGIPVIIITDGEKELSRKAGEKTYSELYSWLEELISKNVK